uniref:Uncharacterized protein n=1 Tax=Cacopsylla melanoneura TaxID=428564 RepID=A0A8D8LL85_9HEMI
MSEMMEGNLLTHLFLRLLGPSENNLTEIFLFILGTVPIWFTINDTFRGPVTALRTAIDNSEGYTLHDPSFALVPLLVQFLLQFCFCQIFGVLLIISSGYITYFIWNWIGLPNWRMIGWELRNDIRPSPVSTLKNARIFVFQICTLLSLAIRFFPILNPFLQQIKQNGLCQFIFQGFFTWLALFLNEKCSERCLVFFLGILTMNFAPLYLAFLSSNPITENIKDTNSNKQNKSHSFTVKTLPDEPNLKPLKRKKKRKSQNQGFC